MNIGELAVAIFQLESDSARCGGCASAHFRRLIFKVVWQVDACAVLYASDGIEDRLAGAVDHAGHNQPRRSVLHIYCQFNRQKQRIQDRARNGGID